MSYLRCSLWCDWCHTPLLISSVLSIGVVKIRLYVLNCMILNAYKLPSKFKKIALSRKKCALVPMYCIFFSFNMNWQYWLLSEKSLKKNVPNTLFFSQRTIINNSKNKIVIICKNEFLWSINLINKPLKFNIAHDLHTYIVYLKLISFRILISIKITLITRVSILIYIPILKCNVYICIYTFYYMLLYYVLYIIILIKHNIYSENY